MPLKRRMPGTSHYLVQFEREVNAGTFRQLRERGIAVTGYLPRTTLMVAAPDDFSLNGMPVRWVGRLESHDKISPLVLARATARGQRVYVIEFHSDVDMQEARALVKEHNLRLIENADVGAHRLLASGPFGALSRLASWDEVAYIFPASPELILHLPVRACAGAVVQQTTVAQYSGPGYPWPVTNGLNLGYVFSELTEPGGRTAMRIRSTGPAEFSLILSILRRPTRSRSRATCIWMTTNAGRWVRIPMCTASFCMRPGTPWAWCTPTIPPTPCTRITVCKHTWAPATLRLSRRCTERATVPRRPRRRLRRPCPSF